MPQDANPTPFPKGLQDIISSYSSSPRPLDPNGIDVQAEIPVMQRAYAKTDDGLAFKGKGEAGYSIFRSDPGVGHSKFVYGSEMHMGIPVYNRGMATVHTHPKDSYPEPSDQDRQSKLPSYVFSGDKLYVTDPKTKKYFKYDIDKWNIPGVSKQQSRLIILHLLLQFHAWRGRQSDQQV